MDLISLGLNTVRQEIKRLRISFPMTVTKEILVKQLNAYTQGTAPMFRRGMILHDDSNRRTKAELAEWKGLREKAASLRSSLKRSAIPEPTPSLYFSCKFPDRIIPLSPLTCI